MRGKIVEPPTVLARVGMFLAYVFTFNLYGRLSL